MIKLTRKKIIFCVKKALDMLNMRTSKKYVKKLAWIAEPL